MRTANRWNARRTGVTSEASIETAREGPFAAVVATNPAYSTWPSSSSALDDEDEEEDDEDDEDDDDDDEDDDDEAAEALGWNVAGAPSKRITRSRKHAAS
jgi:hypothetical protein